MDCPHLEDCVKVDRNLVKTKKSEFNTAGLNSKLWRCLGNIQNQFFIFFSLAFVCVVNFFSAQSSEVQAVYSHWPFFPLHPPRKLSASVLRNKCYVEQHQSPAVKINYEDEELPEFFSSLIFFWHWP